MKQLLASDPLANFIFLETEKEGGVGGGSRERQQEREKEIESQAGFKTRVESDEGLDLMTLRS